MWERKRKSSVFIMWRTNLFLNKDLIQVGSEPACSCKVFQENHGLQTVGQLTLQWWMQAQWRPWSYSLMNGPAETPQLLRMDAFVSLLGEAVLIGTALLGRRNSFHWENVGTSLSFWLHSLVPRQTDGPRILSLDCAAGLSMSLRASRAIFS